MGALSNMLMQALSMLLVLVTAISMGGCEMETELDLSSVPDGLNVPGEQGLPAWYSEMELAY